ncbi:PREDICTED: uncharacterized protein LOC109132504 [Camelina sativa]|uniref:Uncharacterized protein LOC109132504 n=1 Tax=Camelina sativa TaxID=90675 RepID=A0ABM1RKZ4_CAMSA|nr:PREDICTED: uncharacterized protein LOC109132504 [Camelina sativa]
MERGCRQKFAPAKLQDYVINTVTADSDGDFTDSSWYLIDSYVDCSQFLEHHRAFLAAITVVVIPKTYTKAFLDENWRNAALVEIDAWKRVVHQMDVHNSFLHGDLDDEVYIRFPPGFRTDDNNKDYSLFTFADTDIRLHVLVYVDDLIFTGSSRQLIEEFKHYLSTCFRMKDLGISKYFLGIEVARNSTGMYLCQQNYDINSDSGLLGAKPVSHPLEQDHHLASAGGACLLDPFRYRRLVGRLIYLSVTRPDLSYAIHLLSQFMHAQKEDHWEAALRVVRYLKNNPGQGVFFRAGTDLRITAWCDSDYAGYPLSRRSLTAWIIQLGGSPVSWQTRKQDVVSRSSAGRISGNG